MRDSSSTSIDEEPSLLAMILGARDAGALASLWLSLGSPMGTSMQGVSFPVVGSEQRGARALGRAPWCLGLCWEHVQLLARLSPASPFGAMGKGRAELHSQGHFRVVHGFFFMEGGMRRSDAWPLGGFLSPAASQLSRSLSLVAGKGLRLSHCPAWEQPPAAAAAAVFPFRGC